MKLKLDWPEKVVQLIFSQQRLQNLPPVGTLNYSWIMRGEA